MQIDDMLLLRMNRQYLFTPAKGELTVLRDLCGLQAQFYGNCLHALRLRCGKAPDEDILRTSTVKTWTLRGTLHLIAQSDLNDLPLFLYDGRSHFLRPCDTMSDDDRLSAARKRELAAIILDAAQKGCGGREELRLLCREHGMTADEEQSAFDPWGGLLRALCESGLPVERCFYGALTDGFEWLDGQSRRLGLVHIDFETQQRTVKESAALFAEILRTRSVGGISPA